MASNSKRSANDKIKFAEANKNWNLEKLYEDLRDVKQRCSPGKRKVFTETDKCYLRGLLCGYSPEGIADEREVVVGTVNDALSKNLYCYIEELLSNEKKIRHWGDVPNFLEQAGYKVKIPEQSQPSHLLLDKAENTLEASHKIEAISFLEYFSKSIDQLKSKELDVRIGAISTLGTLAKYSQPAEHWTIMEYLTDFVRTNAPRKEEKERKEERSLKLREDIQAALTVIGQRDPEKDPQNKKLDLSNTDIRGANLREGKLQGVNLRKANLQSVNFDLANLQGAILKEVNLQGASFYNANLQEEADLRKANLQEACFLGANLQGAFLSASNMQGVNLRGAKLKGASLTIANLEGASLDGADLSRANLQGANFMGANLLEVDLAESNLQGTKFRGADLTNAKNIELQQIESAYVDSTTTLPDYLERLRH